MGVLEKDCKTQIPESFNFLFYILKEVLILKSNQSSKKLNPDNFRLSTLKED